MAAGVLDRPEVQLTCLRMILCPRSPEKHLFSPSHSSSVSGRLTGVSVHLSGAFTCLLTLLQQLYLLPQSLSQFMFSAVLRSDDISQTRHICPLTCMAYNPCLTSELPVVVLYKRTLIRQLSLVKIYLQQTQHLNEPGCEPSDLA